MHHARSAPSTITFTLTQCQGAPFGSAAFCWRARTALAAHMTYCVTSFARLGFNFRTLFQPLFKDAVGTRVSRGFPRAVEEFTYSPFVRTGLVEGAYGSSLQLETCHPAGRWARWRSGGR